MAAVVLTPDDLAPFATIPEEKADAMIDDALALAARVAPCILTDDFQYAAAAKAILRGAILRWNDAGTGAAVQQSAGPFGVSFDNRQVRRGMFWPSEIEELQKLCQGSESSGAFSVDTAPCLGGGHMPWCSLLFGANYCSCGADLSGGVPLYEGGILTDGCA